MKITHFEEIQPVFIDNEQAKGVIGRVAIGKNDGATNFCMRIFQLSPGGHTPIHSHDWEHEIFIHEGTGEVWCNGKWIEVNPGTVIFIPPGEEHQIKNSGKDMLTFVCLIPAGHPEL